MDGLDVERLDEVETGEDTSAGDTTENVGTVTLEEGGDTLVSENLSTAVKRYLKPLDSGKVTKSRLR